MTAVRPLAGGTVSPRFDAAGAFGVGGRWTNPRTGQGLAPARTSWTSFRQPGALDRYTIDALLRYNGLARRTALREPYDATREGFTLGDQPAQVELARYARKRQALKWVRRGRGWARAYGGAAIVALVDDGQTPDQPIDWGNIRAVRGARVLTRYEITPATYDWGRSSYQVGDVEHWQVNLGHRTVRVHADRVHPMQGTDLPDDVLQRDNGWGGSVFDLVWAELRNYQSSLDYIPEFVSLLTQAVFKQKGLAAGVLAGRAEQIAKRYEALVGGLSILNAMALDADSESYEVVQRPAAGMQEMFDVLIQALVAAGEMPRVILLGETPGGLHAGSDSPEVRAWYDSVKVAQAEHYTDPLAWLLDLFAASASGPTAGAPVDCEVEWLPLYQQTDQEIAQLELTRAQRRSTDVAATVVTGDQARRDPDVARLYCLTPDEVAGTAGDTAALPATSEAALDDADELLPVAAADPSAIPEGESLISAQQAAERLGCTPGTIHRMAAQNAFPAWRVGARWRYAWSLIHASVKRPAPAAPAVH